MTKTKTETQSKNALINLVTSLLPDKRNTIPISTLVLWALDRDYEAAAMFTQCMYWKDRTDDEDGWFYKSYEDWYDEILIAEACARRKVKKLESMGWIQTMVWQVHRTPKLHYRVLMEQVVLDLTAAAESFSEHKKTRQEKKKKDLNKRRERNREKRAETIGNTGYHQNGGNVYLQDGGITTTKMAGSIDKETTSINYISETTEYIKSISGENADSKFELTGNLSNKGGNKTIGNEEQSGTASPGNNPDSCGASENDSHSQNEPYAKPWDSYRAFRVDRDGYAVLPTFPKHKMANFIAGRAMQLELLAEVDECFQMEWKGNGRQCWITTKDEYGLEDDVLGTRKSTGMEKDDYSIVYENDDEVCPGKATLRLLRNVAIDKGYMTQETFNRRLKELWDDAREFLEKDNAMAIFSNCPIYDYMDLNGIEMESVPF